MQGVALRVDSERALFYEVRMLGTQDTLLDNTGTHYFLKCFIQGKVDFVCGSARSLYEVSFYDRILYIFSSNPKGPSSDSIIIQ